MLIDGVDHLFRREWNFYQSMKFLKDFVLASTLFWLLQSPALAVTVEDLFTVELPVADQTTSLRLESVR